MVEARKSGLRYGEVEAILATVKNIPSEGIPAFRARLRHMRNIGVPMGLPQTGRGGVLRFSKDQVFEMLWCLDLQEISWPPKEAAKFAYYIRKLCYSPKFKEIAEKYDSDVFAVAAGNYGISFEDYLAKEGSDFLEIFTDIDGAFEFIRKISKRSTYILMNLTFSQRELDKAILKIAA
jgi:hypothetical protein